LTVASRSNIGHFLLDAMERVVNAPEGRTEWRQRRIVATEGERRVHLAFGVCSQEHSQMIRDLFSWWAQLRHHDLQQATAIDGRSLTTVAILVTPRRDGVRPWDTTMMALPADAQIDSENVALFRQVWSQAEDIPAA
jgi:hypothetical protein